MEWGWRAREEKGADQTVETCVRACACVCGAWQVAHLVFGLFTWEINPLSVIISHSLSVFTDASRRIKKEGEGCHEVVTGDRRFYFPLIKVSEGGKKFSSRRASYVTACSFKREEASGKEFGFV